jgi:DNA polymerase I-like protein with 3'-5' exonuclease and polymerase domains
MRGNPQFKDEIRRVILRAANWARGVGNLDLRRPDVLFPTPEELERAMDDVTAVSIDIETNGLDSDTITIVGLAPIGSTVAYVVPWSGDYRWLLQGIMQSPAITKIGHNFAFDMKAFRAYRIEPAWPVHDTIQAGALLWPPRPRKKAGPETSQVRWLALAACALRCLDGVPMWKQPWAPAAKALYAASWPEVPEWQQGMLYCGLDAYYTGILWQAQMELLKANGMLALFRDIVAPAGFALSQIEARGMLIDIPARDQRIEETKAEIAGLEERIVAFAQGKHQERIYRVLGGQPALDALLTLITCEKHPDYLGKTKRAKCDGCVAVYEMNRDAYNQLRAIKAQAKRLGPVFKPGSDDHWRWLLFEHLKLRPVSVTKKTRKPQVDDESIIKLARRNPGIPCLQWRVDLQHARHRLSGPLAFEVAPDGRVHFGYSIHRTATGRIASGADLEDPDKPRTGPGNAQNLSDRDRRIFVAPHGHVLIQADWSQAEMRAEAWMAGETAMLQAWKEGADIHSFNALDIAAAMGRKDVTLANVREVKFMFGGEMKSFRVGGKTLGLALIYGMGPWKMSKMFGLSVDICERIHRAFFQRWKRIDAYQKELERIACETRLVTNPFGRRIPVEGFVWNDDYNEWRLADREAVLAYPGQSTVGDMVKAVLRDADNIPMTLLDTTTHDSLRWTVPATIVPEVVPKIRQIMERAWPCMGKIEGFGQFRCPTDIAVGQNWGKWHATDNPNGLRDYAA